MLRRISISLVLAALMLAAEHSARAAVLDQQFNPPIPGVVGGIQTTDWAQTFTVGVTGTLSQIELDIFQNGSPTTPLLIDIRTTTGGVPTDPDAGPNVLEAFSIPAADVSTGFPFTPLTIDLAGIPVMTGDVLAITARADTTGDGYSWYGVAAPANPYGGGEAFFRSPGPFPLPWSPASTSELGFRTFVDQASNAVPESATLALAALGLLLLGVRRRRGDKQFSSSGFCA